MSGRENSFERETTCKPRGRLAGTCDRIKGGGGEGVVTLRSFTTAAAASVKTRLRQKTDKSPWRPRSCRLRLERSAARACALIRSGELIVGDGAIQTLKKD